MFSSKKIAAFVFLLVSYNILKRIFELKLKRIPPGPVGLPFIGSFISYYLDQCKFYRKLGNLYGDIVSFKRFGKTIIMINNANILKYIMTKKPIISVTKNVNNTSTGILLHKYVWI